jgi:hypothetical protein
MLKDNIHQAFIELTEKVEQILTERIQKYGVNPKTGSNTIQGSNLERSIDVYPLEDGIALKIADYWEFVARGWEKTGNYPNTMSAFIKNVDDWVKRKNIRFGNMTQSSIVFLITRNIINNGLRARKFMIYDDEGDLTKMIPELKTYLDEWFDKLFNAIMTDVNDYFNAS